MILHTVNKSPLNSPCLKSCLRTLAPQDALLLIEEGVYGAELHFTELFSHLPEGVSLFVLSADLVARGLQNRVNSSIRVINDDEFVDLCCQYPKMQSWY